ncbi:acyl carrier protein [Thermostilla marina]
MTREEIRQAIIDILADISPDDDLDSIDDAKPLRDQLDMDSMDLLDIVLALRRKYRIQIPEEDYPKLVTMNSTIDYLEPLMKDL